MNISIFGTGYVGLVTGACLADVGHNVICVDIDEFKINNLCKGKLPIWEKGLEELVVKNLSNGKLIFTTNPEIAVKKSLIQIIAVGTPSDEDGSADLQYVLAATKIIASHLDDYKVIVIKSTVPVGTADLIDNLIAKDLKTKFFSTSLNIPDYDIVSNPEFLKEGVAVNDFLKPDRIIIGSNKARAIKIMQELYEPFNRSHNRTLFMDVRSSELTKYAANSMLATKISFMNEIANIAEQVGADIEEVRKGIGSDPRIGYKFIYPGCGYGGSCFPKDIKALINTATLNGYNAQLLKSVEAVNNYQKESLFIKLNKYFGGSLQLKTKNIAVWGLSFKPNTDDMRDAPSRSLIDKLIEIGTNINAFDPASMKEAHQIYGNYAQFNLFLDKYSTLKDADALVICTEWSEFRAPDFVAMELLMRNKVIFDGRNIFDSHKLKELGWIYYSIGRKDI
jgi:UDPglucose 6-dehydrogenase